jgi:hypothetical protein
MNSAIRSRSGSWKLDLELAADSGRITGKPEVISADPIRAITSGWPSGSYRSAARSESPNTTTSTVCALIP